MSSLKVLSVFVALIVALHADDDHEKHFAMFKECAEENGLKMDGFKRGERPVGPPSNEMMCTVKCTMEKEGILSGGKILIEEFKKDPKLTKHVPADKMDAALECLKGVEVSDCSDMKKVMDCTHDMKF
uniref:Odorant binding protein 21 n=1 Tax=Harmonia axyridis TaxID=115357 RepID=A0A8J9R776_HARAX|nr:odorant binding protein 21 [Harmonia axyridis]